MTLAQVNTAIEDILLKGQSVTMEGQSLTRANLPGLLDLRKLMTGETAGSTTRPMGRASNFASMGYGDGAATDVDPVRTVAIS